MKSKHYFMIAGVLVLFLLGVVFSYNKNKITEQAHEDHSKEHNITYVCPMHPKVTSDKPGETCSVCGMKLVATELSKAEGNSTHSNVILNEQKQQIIGVKIATITKETLFKSINAPGRIAFDPELYTAQSEYLQGLRQWQQVKGSPLEDVKKSTKEMIESSKIRLKVLGLSSDQIKALARKGSQSEGLLVTGKGLESWVYADVFEVDLIYIKKGLPVQITANYLQGKVLVGEVISVDRVVDRDSRTAKVRIKLKDSDLSIRPESYVNVTIYAPQGEHLAVPIDALMDTGRNSFVFVKKDDGEFVPVNVAVLLQTDEYVAIAGEIKENDQVVVGGNFMLDSESRLKAVLRNSKNKSEHNH